MNPKIQKSQEDFARFGISDEQLRETHHSIKDSFPLDVLPTDVQRIIHATHDCLRYPKDFMATAMLYTAALAIGNTHKVEIMRGYQQNAVLYLTLVGKRGTNKSHPLSFALAPIEKVDQKNFQEYKREKAEYEQIKNLSKTEREETNAALPEAPYWKQYLLTDYTPESLNGVHQKNLRGVGIYSDELIGWFENFNRYNKSGEEQYWLSVWSGKP